MDRRLLPGPHLTLSGTTPEQRRGQGELMLDQAIWAMRALGSKGTPVARALLDEVFDGLPPEERIEFDAEVVLRLDEFIMRALVPRFWWPGDIASFIRIELDARHATLVAQRTLVCARTELDLALAPPAWMQSFREVDAATPPIGAATPSSARWLSIVTVTGRMALAPKIPSTLPRADRWDSSGRPSGPTVLGAEVVADAARRAGLDAKLLERVRALLAKAEGTDFEEEADAFTAKAQELMTRHGIEAALLEGQDHDAAPSERRLWIENPYADVKGLLVNQIAEANRCRVVGIQKFNVRTLVGFDADLIAVEVLFTSLLVQGSAFLRAAGRHQDAQGRTRTASFRRSFWMSFAVRIGDRLQDAVARTVAEADAEAGGALLPVLASREELVASTFSTAFPQVESKTVTASNAAGWAAGHLAADRADLTAASARLAR